MTAWPSSPYSSLPLQAIFALEHRGVRSGWRGVSAGRCSIQLQVLGVLVRDVRLPVVLADRVECVHPPLVLRVAVEEDEVGHMVGMGEEARTLAPHPFCSHVG